MKLYEKLITAGLIFTAGAFFGEGLERKFETPLALEKGYELASIHYLTLTELGSKQELDVIIKQNDGKRKVWLYAPINIPPNKLFETEGDTLYLWENIEKLRDLGQISSNEYEKLIQEAERILP